MPLTASLFLARSNGSRTTFVTTPASPPHAIERILLYHGDMYIELKNEL